MSVIQQAAAERAAKLLVAAGLKFAILLADGRTLGQLPVATEPPAKPRNNLRQYGYLEKVRAMAPGTSLQLPVPAGVDHLVWAGAISAAGCTAHGKGNFLTATAKDRSYVEALRVE